MISNLFDIENRLSGKQINWLKCVSAIPRAKRAMGDEVTFNDKSIAREAKDIYLKTTTTKKVHNNEEDPVHHFRSRYRDWLH